MTMTTASHPEQPAEPMGNETSGLPETGTGTGIQWTEPRPRTVRWRSSGSGTARRRFGPVRARQVVASQVALALPLAAAGQGAPVLAATVSGSVVVLLATWVRVRRRWLHEWFGIGLRYLGRRGDLPMPDGATALLELTTPGGALLPAELAGAAAAVLSDGGGLTAILELGDPGELLGGGPYQLPPVPALLPAAGPDGPAIRVQLLLARSPTPIPVTDNGTIATSYRQLTDGRLPGHERALIAVQVSRTEDWSEEQLRRALSSAVRKVSRRLAPAPSRPLGERAMLRVLAEFAHHQAGQPVRQSWQAVRVGGLLQSTFQVTRWPSGDSEAGRSLVPRLLSLPVTAATVSVAAGPAPANSSAPLPAELTVRLAAGTPAELSVAAQALRGLTADLGAEVRRLDGAHLDGLATTLPLAPAPAAVASAAVLTELELPVGVAGLMIGANRHGAPVVARLFRPEATGVMLVGGIRLAQLVLLRAMALGAQVVLQTIRPDAWEPFVRAVSTPGWAIPMVPPGRPVDRPGGSPLRPMLLVVDAGPVPARFESGPAWQTTLVIRDELTTVDADGLARADLTVLQPLRPDEAALAGTALGLGDSAQWLARIRDDMVAVVNRRALRWALLSPTPIESQLIGRPARW